MPRIQVLHVCHDDTVYATFSRWYPIISERVILADGEYLSEERERHRQNRLTGTSSGCKCELVDRRLREIHGCFPEPKEQNPRETRQAKHLVFPDYFRRAQYHSHVKLCHPTQRLAVTFNSVPHLINRAALTSRSGEQSLNMKWHELSSCSWSTNRGKWEVDYPVIGFFSPTLTENIPTCANCESIYAYACTHEWKLARIESASFTIQSFRLGWTSTQF